MSGFSVWSSPFLASANRGSFEKAGSKTRVSMDEISNLPKKTVLKGNAQEELLLLKIIVLKRMRDVLQ